MDYFQEQEIAGKLYDASLTRRMVVYCRPYTRWLVLCAVLILPLVFLGNSLHLVTKNAVDQFLVPLAPAAAGAAADAAAAAEPALLGIPRARFLGLARLGLIYILIAGGAFVFRYGQAYLMAWIGQRIVFDLRAAVFAKVLRLPVAYFDRNPVGRLMTRVSSDVDAIQRLLTDGLVGLIGDFATLFGVIGFMYFLSPLMTTVVLLLMPLLLGVMTLINYQVRKGHRTVRLRQSALNAFLQEMITGMTTVQLFNRESTAVRRFDQQNAGLREAFMRSTTWFCYYFPSLEIMNALSIAAAMGAGAFVLFPAAGSGQALLSIGGLIAFINYVRDFFRPLESLSDKSNVFQSAMASAERVFGLMDEPETVADPPDAVPLAAFRGEVEFDHVGFAYRDEDWVLKDLSFRIRPGESVAFVGATGAGKSSVISLIARFYDVQKGAVRVDGVDVRRYRQSELRRRIGIVLQDPFIFSGRLVDNITLLNPAVSREAAIAAAEYVNADGFIRGRADGYDHALMERGAGLSTGQKQLLALARAIAQDPDILLILDEATASVDTETEQLIQDALRKVMRGRTSIVIAHRLSTIRHVDRILVMRHGEIVEQGSHDDLVRQGGYYKRLYDLLSHSAPR